MAVRNYIPNTVTCMNLVCGVVGIVFAIRGRLDFALYAMLGGAFFDFCDGFVARALKAGSAFGKQLDSLSDVITFGLLPGLMFTMYMVSAYGVIYVGEMDFTTEPIGWSVWACVPLLLPVFAALRLAKFNVDEAQTTSFLGLATPASALLCGCLTYFVYGHPSSFLAEWARGPIFLPFLSLILCALMVSRIPMFSLKINAAALASPSQKMTIVIAAAVIVAIIVVLLFVGIHISLIATILLTLYPLYNIVRAIKKPRN
ncbi:MAG: CDP-alcohol phosphatidyltransferase family protein [Bacteroidales bacterium]|nr:CDP-alcohol phosphatidyltransferase family protein [Bacteroidales bacterium]